MDAVDWLNHTIANKIMERYCKELNPKVLGKSKASNSYPLLRILSAYYSRFYMNYLL